MFLVKFQLNLDPLHELYVTFDEPLPQRVYLRFLPLAYGILFVLHVISSFLLITHHEHVIILLDR